MAGEAGAAARGRLVLGGPGEAGAARGEAGAARGRLVRPGGGWCWCGPGEAGAARGRLVRPGGGADAALGRLIRESLIPIKPTLP